MICTTPDCETPTETYLCNQCVSDLQAWIDRVPDMREELFTTMARLDCVAPQNSEGGGGGATEAPSPLNVGAMDMRHALLFWEGAKAERLANDKHAGGFLTMLQDLLDKAERIIDLPKQSIIYGPCLAMTEDGECERELKADPEATTIDCPDCGAFHRVKSILAARALRARGAPLPPREVREYLAKKVRVFIQKKDLENWVSRGDLRYVLDRVTTAINAQRIYYPGDVLEVFQDKEARKRTLV